MVIPKTDPKEMQRRWKVMLEAMEKEGIECLVLSENGFNEGGNPGATVYVTDIPPGNYTQYFLFAKEGISAFSCGPRGGKMALAAEKRDNILNNIQLPSIPSTTYSWTWFPEEMVKVIKHHGYKKVAFVGYHNVTMGTYKYLTENLPGVEFCDFTDQLDHIKAVKSEYELGLFQACVDLHDNLVAAVPSVLRAGIRKSEVRRRIRALAEDMNCTQLNILIGSFTTEPHKNASALDDYVIQKGEYFNVLVEVADHYNIWGECGRVFAMGMDPSPLMQKALADQIKVMDFVAASSVPGASPAEVFIKTNEMLAGMGYNVEKRFSVHGQGYEIVDRPMWVAEETMILQENMFYANHPNCINKDVRCGNTDNYVVKPGGSVKLSKTPREIVVIPW